MSPQPVRDSSPSPSPAEKQRWIRQVGTLTYTRSALIQVMFWMLWGDFFFELLESLPGGVIPLQLRWEGASDWLIGSLGSLSSIIAFFWYPVVATQSDRHRSRLGRRRPFLLWCTPPVVLSLVLLGSAKPAGAFLHRVLSAFVGASLTAAGCTIAWIGACAILFFLFNAYIVQVYSCLVADVIPQQELGKFTGIYRAVGALGSFAFNRWLLGWAEAYTFHIYCLIGLLYAGAFYMIVWRVKEGEYPLPPPRAPGGRWGAVKIYIRECYTHRFYLNFYCVPFFFWSSLAPLGFLIFFGTRAGRPNYAPTLGLTLQEFGQIKGWTFLIQIPVFFIAGYCADLFHPLRVAIAGLLLASVSYFCCFWFVHGSTSLLLWWGINQAAIAVFLAAYLTMLPKLLPREKYGQFFSANAIFGMVGLIFTPPAVGLILETIRDYRYIFVLCGGSTGMAFFACVTLFLQWKKLGGDQYFASPV